MEKKRRIIQWKDLTIIQHPTQLSIFSHQSIRKWVSKERICRAFKNHNTSKNEPKTWFQLTEEIPKATLSRHLRELIKSEHIKGYKTVNERGELVTTYELIKDWRPPPIKYPGFRIQYKNADGSLKDLGVFFGKIARYKTKTGLRTYLHLSLKDKVLIRKKIAEAEKIA